MKNWKLLLLMLLFICCDRPEPEPEPVLPENVFSISETEYVISEEGGVLEVGLEHSEDYEVEVHKDNSYWIRQVVSRSEVSALLFQIEPNDDVVSRQGQILVRPVSRDTTIVVTVTQMQHDAIILSPSKHEVEASGGRIQVKMKTNVMVKVGIPSDASDWIASVETRALEEKMLTFEVASNPEYAERRAELTFVSVDDESLSQKVTVIQAGRRDVMMLEDEEIDVPGEGGEITVAFSHEGIEYDVTVRGKASEWIHKIETRSEELVTDRLLFSILPNPDQKERTGKICFVSKASGQQLELVVNQSYIVNTHALRIVHEKRSFEIPQIKGTVLSGVVTWGDGLQEDYSHGLSHDYYSNDERVIELVLKAKADVSTVTFEDIEGINEIDLSGF